MRAATTSSLVVLTAALVGCVTTPAPGPSARIPASEAVIRELHETRPAFTELTADEQTVVHLWLLANCAVGINDRRVQFIEPGARLEAALIEAFRMGPPAAYIGELSAARRADYVAIKAQLQSEEEPFGSPDLRKRLLTLSEETYLTDGLQRAVINYKLAALEGLGLVGSQTGVAWLERTAQRLDPE